VFDVAQMSSAEVRRYNRTAHAYGRHLCPKCMREFDHTTEYFYASAKRRADGSIILEARCKACRDAQTVEDNRTRYQTCADYRELRKQSSRKYYESLSPVARKAAARKRAQRRSAAA